MPAAVYHKTSISIPNKLWEELQQYAQENDLKISAIFRLGFRKLKDGGSDEKPKRRAKATI